MADEEAKEYKIPLILLAAGFGIFLVAGFVHAGPKGVAGSIIGLAIGLAVEVLLLLLGAVITAKLIGVSFGFPQSAALKLAAIALFPGAIAALINITFVGWAISVILYLALLVFLFELDLKEALIFTGVMIVLRLVAVFALGGLLASLR